MPQFPHNFPLSRRVVCILQKKPEWSKKGEEKKVKEEEVEAWDNNRPTWIKVASKTKKKHKKKHSHSHTYTQRQRQTRNNQVVSSNQHKCNQFFHSFNSAQREDETIVSNHFLLIALSFVQWLFLFFYPLLISSKSPSTILTLSTALCLVRRMERPLVICKRNGIKILFIVPLVESLFTNSSVPPWFPYPFYSLIHSFILLIIYLFIDLLIYWFIYIPSLLFFFPIVYVFIFILRPNNLCQHYYILIAWYYTYIYKYTYSLHKSGRNNNLLNNECLLITTIFSSFRVIFT